MTREKDYDNNFKNFISRCSEKTLQSNENGFFLQFANNVRKVAGNNWINNVFGKLTSDRERFKIVFEYSPVKDVICETLSHVQEIYRPKNASVSYARRLAGEKMEANGELQKALLLYSQSVLRAPGIGEEPKVDDGFTLPLALWSRSKLNIKLKNYSEALIDIQLALKEELSDVFQAEAYKNMAISYKGLNDLSRAKICLAISQKMANNENIRKAFQKEFDKQPIENIKQKEKYLPEIKDKSSELQHGSSKLTIQKDGSNGRYVVAKEKIVTGETLVVEPPYAACLLPDFFGTHCHHCFQRLLSPVGCKTCSSVAFCTPQCRDKALESYHRYECTYLDLLIGSGMSILSHTALRMITQSSLGNYDKTEPVNKLCTNADKRSAEDFLQRTVMAAFLLRILQKSGYFKDGCANEEVIPEEEELKVGETLLYYLQMLQFNAHEIYETRRSPNHDLKDAKAVYIGVAIYPTVALFNHDCHPAVIRYFIGKHIVITASRPLDKGETVPENYGPIFAWKPLEERQKWLLGRYWFKCQCLACTNNWPTTKNGLENVPKKIRCSTKNCSGLFSFPLTKTKVTCICCKKDVDLTARIAEFKSFEEFYNRGKEYYLKKDIHKAIAVLVEAVEIFHRISVPPNEETYLAQEMLRHLYAETGNVYEVNTS